LLDKIRKAEASMKEYKLLAKSRMDEIEQLRTEKREVVQQLGAIRTTEGADDVAKQSKAYMELKLKANESDAKLAAASAAQARAEKERNQVKADLDKCQRERKMDMHRLKLTMEEEVKKCQKELLDAQTAMDSMKKEMTGLRLRLSSMTAESKRDEEFSAIVKGQQEKISALEGKLKTVRESARKDSSTESEGDPTDELYAEIESASEAIARLEEQNTALLEKARDYKNKEKKILSEEAKLKQQFRIQDQKVTHLKQAVATEKKAKEAETLHRTLLKQKLDKAEQEIVRLNDQIARLEEDAAVGKTQQAQGVGSFFEQTTSLLRQKSDALSRELSDEKIQMEDVRNNLKRALEENKKMKLKVSTQQKEIRRLERTTQAKEVSDVKDLYAEMETSLQCTIIPGHWKDTVLSSCGHLFSKAGIDQLVAQRTRKCPTCSKRFGQDYIKRVHGLFSMPVI
jgi:E3 ubiquitin-protein ligase BRE1